MVRAELRETRSPGETNWYFAIEVWACAWAIGNMHWASTKLKLSFYSINLYVAFTQWKNYAFLYSYSRIRWIKRTLQIKLSRLIKKSIWSIHLNPKTKSISRTPVSRVTGGDTHHYTAEELDALDWGLMGYVMRKRHISLQSKITSRSS